MTFIEGVGEGEGGFIEGEGGGAINLTFLVQVCILSVVVVNNKRARLKYNSRRYRNSLG